MYTLAVLHPPFFQATPDAWKLGHGTRFAGEGVHQPAAMDRDITNNQKDRGDITYKYIIGGMEHFLFSHILGIIILTDELIFFRGVGIPPTRIYIFLLGLYP